MTNPPPTSRELVERRPLWRRIWSAWRGQAGDELIQMAGIVALLAYVADKHGFPDPLPVAVFACLLLHRRYADRAALKESSE